ncbi:MAG TPA: hypothetical protein VFE47_17225 [Tepidisphaeraceae bacterium]|jgi:hypothetical protein|nr:hypothetical protein [Tepidisphaeraceae bacterium]
MTAKRSPSDDDLLSSIRQRIDQLCQVLGRHEVELSASPGNAYHKDDGLQGIHRAIEAAQQTGIDAERALNRRQATEAS